MKYNLKHFEEVVKQVAQAYNFTIHLADDSTKCDTLEKISSYYSTRKALLVWTGGSDNTIFKDKHSNYLFRAWHDLHHITKQLPFTLEGEKAVCWWQSQDVLRIVDSASLYLYCKKVLDCEIIEQAAHYEETGKFIENQKAFTLAKLAVL